MCDIQLADEVSVLKHVLCRLVGTSDFIHTKMSNIVIKQKLENSFNRSKMYHCKYNSCHLLEQFPSLASTTNELPLVYGTRIVRADSGSDSDSESRNKNEEIILVNRPTPTVCNDPPEPATTIRTYTVKQRTFFVPAAQRMSYVWVF